MSDLSAQKIFDELLPEFLKGDNADSAPPVGAFHIEGDTGGIWTLHTNTPNQSSGFIAEGADEDARCSITMKEDHFVRLWEGDLDGRMAFMTGKLKIKGDMGVALGLQKLLESAREHSSQ